MARGCGGPWNHGQLQERVRLLSFETGMWSYQDHVKSFASFQV